MVAGTQTGPSTCGCVAGGCTSPAGQPPTVTEDDAPPARGALPDDVLSDLSETMATVSYDGWYVRLGESKLEINRTRARRVSGQRKFGRPLERHRRSR